MIDELFMPAGAGAPEDEHSWWRAEQVRTCAAFLDELSGLRGWLLARGVTQVAVEADFHLRVAGQAGA